jgi:single-strand DNA-binding protein
MKSNYVKLTGNVGVTPRINTFDESSVMNLAIATNEKMKNKAGEVIEETVWHNIVAWSNPKMIDFKQIQKGSRIIVEGRIRPVHYTTKTGIEKQSYEIVAASITLG